MTRRQGSRRRSDGFVWAFTKCVSASRQTKLPQLKTQGPSGRVQTLDFDAIRRVCSKTDDAERFRYRFWDDVAGWRLTKVRFQDLAREDVSTTPPMTGSACPG